MNYRDFTLGDWIEHINENIEDEDTLDGNEMRDLVDFLTTMQKSKTDRIEYGTDGNPYTLSISNGKEYEQEPCDDAISRQDAYKCLEIHGDYDTLNEVFERLKKLPPVNPQESYYKDLANSYEKTINKLTKAIAEQGSVLDKVNREIKEYCEKNCIDGDIVADELSLIIDKYRKEG